MKIEFVGGPRCGDTRVVQALPSSIDTTHEAGVPDNIRRWVVSYRRTGEKLQNGNYRYVYAGQRDLFPVSAV